MRRPGELESRGRSAAIPAAAGSPWLTCGPRARVAQPGQLDGERRLEGHRAPVRRMDESELTGVQGQPRRAVAAPAVHRVADHRVSGVGEVDADLVGPAGAQPDLQLGGPRVAGEHPEVGDGGAAAVHHGHPLAIAGVAADRRVDGGGGFGELAVDQRPVDAGEAALLELGGEVAVRLLDLATTSRPEVSRSRRCTIPGRSSPPSRDQTAPR